MYESGDNTTEPMKLLDWARGHIANGGDICIFDL